MARRWIPVGWAALTLFGAASAQAATFTVAGTSDQPAATGTCNVSTRICTSLRAAVANVPSGATIGLGAHQYLLSTGPLRIHQSLTITGTGASSTSIEQTLNGAGVLQDDGGDLTLNSLTVTGGRRLPTSVDQDLAGGIYDAGGSSLTLNGVAVTGNTSTGFSPVTSTGGGDAVGGIQIDSHGTALTLSRSVIGMNVATGGHGGPGGDGSSGGAAYGALLDSGSTLAMSNSTVTNNTATGGTGGTGFGGPGTSGGFSGQSTGGVVLILHAPSGDSILSSAITANRTIGGAGGAGISGSKGGPGNTSSGAINSILGNLTVKSSLIAGNSNQGSDGGSATGAANGGDGGGASGGGLVASGGSVAVVNSTVVNNSSLAGSGGTGQSGGLSGFGEGGGAVIESPASVSLVADTFAGNHAAGRGGNLELAASTLIQDTLISGGVAPSGANCDVQGSGTIDTGYNLESTTPSQCGFSAAHKDLVGTNPMLAPLAANGGPTQTEALAATSPARGAGGPCYDPTAMTLMKLGIDQRGLPRPTPCDIGAFQSEVPSSVSPPKIRGPYVFAKRLACLPGTWSGDGLKSPNYQWSRGARAIAGASRSTYAITARDFGIQLSCRVTRAGTYGHASALAAVMAPKRCNCTPRLSHVSESHQSWLRKNGTTFRFSLDRVATVTFRFRSAHGDAGATIKVKGHRGANKLGFKGDKLSPGRYTVSLSAALPVKGAPASRPVKLSFTIQR